MLSMSATFHALTIIRRDSGFVLMVLIAFASWSMCPPR